MKLAAENASSWRVTALSAGPLLLFVIAAATFGEQATDAVNALAGLTSAGLGLFWQLLMPVTFVLALVLSLGPTGRIRLGGARPEVPYPRWLAVIMCTLLAGGGVFWSAAEPMYHFVNPPPLFGDVAPNSPEAATNALAQSFFHWGFLAWAGVGTVAALALMLFHDRTGRPLLPRSLVEPIVGRKVAEGPLGDAVDGVSVLAAAAGTIGPIGFLGLQMAFALQTEVGVPDTTLSRVLVLAALVGLATASTMSGLRRGIEWLSQLNVGLALALAAVVLLLGPGPAVASRFFASFGVYLSNLPAMTVYRGDPAWLSFWTVFYWGWFLGYGPLMALFVARISRGRTVREICLTVAVVAPLATNAWFAVLGGSGLVYELATPGLVSSALETNGLPAVLLAIVSKVPGEVVWVPGFLTLTFLFLATSVDSMAYAMSMISSQRDLPAPTLRAFWAILMGVVAALLVVLGEDSIKALQAMIVVTAAPVSLVLLAPLWFAPAALFGAVRRRDYVPKTQLARD